MSYELSEAIGKFAAIDTPEGMYGSEHDSVLNAARRHATGAPVMWCEEHQRSGFRLEDGFGYCTFAEAESCRMVERWLTDLPAEEEA